MTEKTPDRIEKPESIKDENQTRHSNGLDADRFISMLRSRIVKRGVIALCLLFLVFFIIRAGINHSYKKDIIRNSKELAAEIEQFVAMKYGELSQKRNGWTYVAALPDMDGVSYEVIDDESYKALSLEQKKAKLTDLGVFKFCEDFERLSDYDVIVPGWFCPFDIDGFDQLLIGNRTLGLLKIKNAINSLAVCADWYHANSEKEKGLKLEKRGFQFAGILPTADLLHIMIRIAGAQILLEHIREHFEEYSKGDLESLEKEIAGTCLLEPVDYYGFWLFEAYSMCAYILDEDILKEMAKYRNSWNPGFVSWFLENLLCADRMIADGIASTRKCHAILKKKYYCG